MDPLDKEIVDDKLTQADLIKLMLHNAQHMATREEVKSDITKVEISLKEDISKLDNKISKVETSLRDDMSKMETSLRDDMSKLDDKISKVETSLKNDMSKMETSLKKDISKIDAKFDKIQWLIIATMFTVVVKDYIFSILK